VNNQYNIWCKWHPLKTVMLGSTYDVSFYENIKNRKIKDALIRITEETQEDLARYEKVLKDFGCNVIRPVLDSNDRIDNYINPLGELMGGVPRPPLQPRDAQLVIGNKLYYTNNDHPAIKKALDEYNPVSTKLYSESDVSGELIANDDKYTWAPNVTVVGKDIYYDVYGGTEKYYFLQHESLNEEVKKFRWHQLSIGGHNDGVFHTIKPNNIISHLNVQTYEKTFPGWDVLYVDRSKFIDPDGRTFDDYKKFKLFKKKVRGSWWVPNEEGNDDFTDFTEQWLKNWTGYVTETLFDVNVLVLDEHHICVNRYHKEIFDRLKQIKMEPIIVPYRHRFFWDGGLHCITLDLYREGVQEDYFPERGDTMLFDDIVRESPMQRMG